jgi:hypothetical protein
MTRSAYVYDLHNNLKPSGCAEYHRNLQQRTWIDQALDLNFASHGHIHELMGGSFHFRKPLPIINKTSNLVYGDHAYTAIHYFQHSAQAWSKLLWRNGHLSCPQYGSIECPRTPNRVYDVSMDTQTACACDCVAQMYASDSDFIKVLDSIGKNHLLQWCVFS